MLGLHAHAPATTIPKSKGMSASSRFTESPMSRSRTSSATHADGFVDQRGNKPSQQNTSSHIPRSTSSASDEANAGVHSLAEPPERGASKTQHDDRAASSHAALPAAHRQAELTTGANQARARLGKQLKRLEAPPARSDASTPHASVAQAQKHHGRETSAEPNGPAILAPDHGDGTKTRSPQRVRNPSKETAFVKKSPRRAGSMSSPARKAKVWCGNNKLDKQVRANGGHLEIGSPHACFTRGVGGGIHQKVPPSEEDAFIEKWIQPYEKLVQQPIWFKAGPVPSGMFRCTLPQALARGFAVGSIQRAKKILKQRGHTAHGA